MKALWLVVVLGGCDPMWGAKVSLRDPDDRPIGDATVAVACSDGDVHRNASMSARTKRDGSGFVGSIGGTFPVGCDVVIAKPGYRTKHIRYHDLCPGGPDGCKRVFEFDLVLEPQ